MPGEGARLVTTMTRHPGGASVQVHARIDESFTLVYDALVSPGGQALGAADRGRRRRGDRGRDHRGRNGSAEAPASRAAVEEPDAETLSDSLTNRYLPAGMGRWSPDSGETIAERLGTIVCGGDGLRARGPAVGGAADRAGPGLADGGADQEPRRVRLRPAAHPVDGGARRQSLRRREADRVCDRAPRRGRAAGRAPEDADGRRDRQGAGRAVARRPQDRRAEAPAATEPSLRRLLLPGTCRFRRRRPTRPALRPTAPSRIWPRRSARRRWPRR